MFRDWKYAANALYNFKCKILQKVLFVFVVIIYLI